VTSAPQLLPIAAGFRAGVRDRLRSAAEAKGLDGMLLLSPANVTYACGFDFSVNERPIGLYVPVNGEPVLVVPLLELENAEPVTGVRLKVYEEFPGPEHPVLWMVRESGARRLAVDTLDARLATVLSARLDELCLEDLAAPLRHVKTAEELALVRAAARYADLCLERLLEQAGQIIAQGGSELDLYADCTSHALAALRANHGAAFAGTRLAITASVHSGPRAALPHGATSTRRPQQGDTVICGVGCALGGYHAESGTTLFVGDLSAEQRRVADAMTRCDAAARDALSPGARCEDVNAAAMAALRDAGLGDAIRHRIGHGMGVEGHEAPWLAPGDATLIAPGMVFSSEPGVYRPGHDGYRTINTFIVTDGAAEVPSRFLASHPVENRIIL
jgi:Xaa-Pro dipeptidase